MTKRSPVAARAVAATALLCGFLIVVLVVAGSLDGGGGGGHSTRRAKAAPARKPGPAAYVVQNGDTLSSIAHKTGVSVARIEKLNRGIDPQILISGEKLKLR